MLTDYGEPALSDFGIAHITGGFKTATGTFTGSPAFTAPEILSGDPPSRASDVYGLGATLFAALTGHAAFERRSGEQMVAQFLRIASESAPDLRESGIPDDVCAVVEKAMAARPARPSVRCRNWVTNAAAADCVTASRSTTWRCGRSRTRESRPRAATTGAHHAFGNLPLELTSFVGRRTELSEVRNMLAASRLVTLTGIGGVGKTRLALRAASRGAARISPTGCGWSSWVSCATGRCWSTSSPRPLGCATSRPDRCATCSSSSWPRVKLLLVLDNCEQVVECGGEAGRDVACGRARNCGSSRPAARRSGIGGETVLRLPPLAFPDADREPTLAGCPATMR